jgi:hypothetical protein
MRPVAIKFIREPAAARLIGAPRPLGLLSFDELRFDAWNVERPHDVITAVGLNARQALDDAMIKLACAGWKIRLRRALPAAAELPSSRLA